jgi:fructoselysine-6-P-deglycase FrlB-like protein
VGRSYQREISELPATYDYVAQLNISSLVATLQGILDKPLVAIGSGGSLSAASYLCLLHTMTSGKLARAMTPLEASVGMPASADASVAFVSASGRNKDILAALTNAVQFEPPNMLAAVVRPGSPLADRVERYARGYAFELGIGVSKDGYLATNSLVAFYLLFARSYAALANSHSQIPIPKSLDEIGASIRLDGNEDENLIAERLSSCTTLCVVHCPLSAPAASDIESRLTESAVLNVQLADLRNFAHGRHYWLASRCDDSVVLFLASDHFADLAVRTARQLPPNVRSLIVRFSSNPCLVAIAALLFSIRLTGAVASNRNIDPGKPHVPLFGRRIYHLPQPANPLPRHLPTPVLRKSLAMTGHACPQTDPDRLCAALAEFRARLGQATFRALVADFDGTMVDTKARFGPISKPVTDLIVRLLKHQVWIGIVSGRGASLLESLRGSIPAEFHPRVLVAQHHGATVAALDREAPLSRGTQNDEWQPVLTALAGVCHGRVKIGRNQLRIEATSGQPIALLWREVAQKISTANISGLRILTSAHSVDIVSHEASKKNIVDALTAFDSSVTIDRVLAIGDMGLWPGNDYDLLSLPFSLSVASVSADLQTCWNLAPAGLTNRTAFEFYLSRVRLSDLQTFLFSDEPSQRRN